MPPMPPNPLSHPVMPATTQSTNAVGTTSGKLRIACSELEEQLIAIGQTPPEVQILHAAPPSQIHSSQPTVGEESLSFLDEGGSEGYRCKCTFQIVRRSDLNGNTAVDTATTDGDDLTYAIREGGEILSLQDGIFPPANRRIRRAMLDLMDCLNRKIPRNDNSETNGTEEETPTFAFGRLRNNLTSVTFVTSWGDGSLEQSNSNCENASYSGGDCLVTLNYGPPGLPTGSYSRQQSWKVEAKEMCAECNFTSLTGRSKGIKISVPGSNETNSENSLNKSATEEGIIHDDLWLTIREDTTNDSARMVEIESVSLVQPTTSSLQLQKDDGTTSAKHSHVQIQYQKPATAFQHPNAGVMISSLHWILNSISKIALKGGDNTNTSSTNKSSRTKPRMLEMYCGCGAHTIPLAKSTILSEIVALERDDRLVNACRNNCRLNDCLNEHDSCNNDGNERTLVKVVKGDATEWAAKTLRGRCKHDTNPEQFDILLVDPPRDGLSATVCDMAMNGTFAHIIYVSCGKRALLRDLTILCGKTGSFDVVDLAVIDLFPGTPSVETLVHLKRRQKN